MEKVVTNEEVSSPNKIVVWLKKFISYFNKENYLKVVQSKWFLYALCFVASFSLLMLCSMDSFLYGVSTWCDANAYITIGNGMVHGKVPYRDLYDHKGPVVYFMFALTNLFSNPYTATYVMESICLGLFIYQTVKVADRWINNNYLSLCVSIVVAYALCTASMFNIGGGCVEFYLLPILMYFINIFFDFVSDKNYTKLTKTRSLFIGLWLAVIFWVKFTLLLLPGIILVYWLVVNLFKKNFKQTFINIGFMAISFVGLTFLIFIYFIVNGALKDLFDVYFYDNIFLYTANPTFARNYGFFKENWMIFAVGLIGIIPLWNKFKWNSFVIFAIAQIQVFMTFYGNCETYYLQPFIVYMVFGVIALCMISRSRLKRVANLALVFATLFVCLTLSFVYANPIGNLSKEKEDYVQYQVAADIHASGIENPTLNCYVMKDYGFYNAAGIVATEKYYTRVNFSKAVMPEMYDCYRSSVIEKRCDFIVLTNQLYAENKNFLLVYYDLYKEYSGYKLLIKK